MQYTIGEISKRLDMQPSTLRYYDKEGLMPNVKRTNGGIRIFDDSDYELLTLIECLKRTGMSLKDIKVFIDWTLEGDSSIDKRLELIRKQKMPYFAQMDKLNETLRNFRLQMLVLRNCAKSRHLQNSRYTKCRRYTAGTEKSGVKT